MCVFVDQQAQLLASLGALLGFSRTSMSWVALAASDALASTPGRAWAMRLKRALTLWPDLALDSINKQPN